MLTFCELKCAKCSAIFEIHLKKDESLVDICCPDCKCPYVEINVAQDTTNRAIAFAVQEILNRIGRIEGFLLAEFPDAAQHFDYENQ